LSSTLTLTENYNVELVIVDGNSTDNTFKIVNDFMSKNKSYYASFKVLRDPGFSLSFARHLGFKNSRGNILIFLDGDTPLTTSFVYNLEKELGDGDLISPIFRCVPLDEATRVFNEFMKTVSYVQIDVTEGKGISDPSILPPARIFKRVVLEKMKGYPVSSSFFGEDRITTALAVRLGFRYKFSTRLKLFKIDEPGFNSYWRKHYRYALGIHRDITSLGRQILRGYIVSRRIIHLNTIFPVISLIYGFNAYNYMKNPKKAVEIALMKYFIDTAMFLGDIIGVMKS
jgi:glycosyltransferase involved in cell wall biosynthesis